MTLPPAKHSLSASYRLEAALRQLNLVMLEISYCRADLPISWEEAADLRAAEQAVDEAARKIRAALGGAQQSNITPVKDLTNGRK